MIPNPANPFADYYGRASHQHWTRTRARLKPLPIGYTPPGGTSPPGVRLPTANPLAAPVSPVPTYRGPTPAPIEPGFGGGTVPPGGQPSPRSGPIPPIPRPPHRHRPPAAPPTGPSSTATAAAGTTPPTTVPTYSYQQPPSWLPRQLPWGLEPPAFLRAVLDRVTGQASPR